MKNTRYVVTDNFNYKRKGYPVSKSSQWEFKTLKEALLKFENLKKRNYRQSRHIIRYFEKNETTIASMIVFSYR